MKARILIAAVVAALVATALLLGGVLRESQGTAGASAAVRPAPAPPANATDAQIRQLQVKLRLEPDDVRSLAALGLQYEQRMRETADPTYLTKADGVLHRALKLAPQSPEATIGLGSLALSRHDFRGALVLGRRAIRLAPGAGLPYGITGDALLALGRYDAAFRTFDRMVREEPGASAYARIAYARELLGNRAGALQAMRLALQSSEGQGEAAAWVRFQIGKLLFNGGRTDAAIGQYRMALRELPGYVHALDGLAQAEAAKGNTRVALRLSRRAVETVPLPQFVTTLADILQSSGDRTGAREQYALVGAVERLLRANGVKSDLEIAQFYVDHGQRLGHALELARRAYAERPSIDGDDVLGWALVRNGRCGEGLHYATRSLRLGTRDASKFFHRGMAERCAGHAAEARIWFERALALNPHFSLLWSPVARRLA
jgi:tetratricopeptide (TPR) repeat protein